MYFPKNIHLDKLKRKVFLLLDFHNKVMDTPKHKDLFQNSQMFLKPFLHKFKHKLELFKEQYRKNLKDISERMFLNCYSIPDQHHKHNFHPQQPDSLNKLSSHIKLVHHMLNSYYGIQEYASLFLLSPMHIRHLKL